jgi:acetyl-CoA C-acetyltransferase
VLSAGLGQNVARQVALGAGVPDSSIAYSVNMMCASGLHAASLAASIIKAGEAKVVLCGGAESMTNAPYVLEKARGGYKLGDGALIDTVLRDGLVDAFDHQHMGVHTDALAESLGISRDAQDRFALQSQRRAAAAMAAGAFNDEVAALKELAVDEHPRPDTTIEKLGSLKPAFAKTGTVTAGNASGINDAAAMLVLCDEETARANGWRALAVFSGHASAGTEPGKFALGPIVATNQLCRRMGTSPDMFDTVELNEAFAAQALACIDGLRLDPALVNVDGGAIALGHPIGASGARLLVHLAHRTARGQSKRSLASLCVGGGMGIAAMVEAV